MMMMMMMMMMVCGIRQDNLSDDDDDDDDDGRLWNPVGKPLSPGLGQSPHLPGPRQDPAVCQDDRGGGSVCSGSARADPRAEGT